MSIADPSRLGNPVGPEPQITEAHKIEPIYGYFQPVILEMLQRCVAARTERKRTFRLDRHLEVPDEIGIAANSLRWWHKLEINTAVVKHYRVGEPNNSYKPHMGPKRFHGDRVAFCTINGEATLYLRNGEEEEPQSILCVPNTLVIIDPATERWLTPPQNPEGIRDFVFFGYDHTLDLKEE